MSVLREARENTGLSREKVAARLAISARTIERWENGVNPPPRWQLRRLAKIYEVPVDTLDESHRTAA